MTIPPEYLSLPDYEAASKRVLDNPVWSYLAGGAGQETSVAGNLAAFQNLWLRPQPLASKSAEVATSVELLGQASSMPVLLAPTSPQRLFHAAAELATAEAASASGVIAIVSSDSHYPLRSIGAVGPFWFQLYCYGSVDETRAMVELAEDSGARAIVLTVDGDFVARRLRQWRSGFKCPSSVEFGILKEVGYHRGPVPSDTRLPRRPLDWKDVETLRGLTQLPVLLKGILHPADVRMCINLGVDGLVVSNHGGRQLDSCVPTIMALPDIVGEASGECVVLLDGGVRSGVDVIKAMAIGADAVCIGRPYLWGLSIAGARGVQEVLSLLRVEIEDTLRQIGNQSVRDVSKDKIVLSPLRSIGL